MLQRALATLLCLLGVVAISLAAASATVWRPSDTLVAQAQAADGGTMVVTAPGVLDLAADEVLVEASAQGDQPVVIALGRTSDVEAWVGEDVYTLVTGLADAEALRTEVVEPAPEEAEEGAEEPEEGEADEAEAPDPETEDAEAAAEEDAEPRPAPDPAGSDLWVTEVDGAGEAELSWTTEPGRWSVLVATTGEDAAPPSVSLTWPQEVRTPWLVPGVAVGSVLLLAGIVWWALLLIRARREARRPAPIRVTSTPAGGLPLHVGTVTPVGGARTGQTSSPRAEDVGPGVGAAAAGPAPLAGAEANGTEDLPTGPMTRRQIRELEQRRALEARQATSRGRRPARGDENTPTGQTPVVPPPVPAPAPVAETREAPATPAAATGRPADVADEPQAAAGWRGRLGRVLPTRRSEDAPAEPGSPGDPGRAGEGAGALGERPGSAPGTGAEGTPAGPAPLTWSTRPQAGQSASADAWRKAWGFGPDAGAASPAEEPAPSTDDPDVRDGSSRGRHDEDEGGAS